MRLVAKKLGVTGETLRSRVRHAQVDGGHRRGLTSYERRRMKQPEGEVKANDILKAALLLCDRARRSTEEAVRFIHIQRNRTRSEASLGVEPILQGVAVRSRHLLRSEDQAALCTASARRGVQVARRHGRPT